MVIAWFGYCLLVSALLGLAAFAAERALGHYRKPVRGVWVGALAGSLLLPLVAYIVPAVVARLSPVPQGVPISVQSLTGLTAGGAAAVGVGLDWAAVWSAAGTLVAWLWGVSVLALGGYLVGSYRGLKREMEGWTPGRILDAPVMMSRNRGPAVVGIRHSVIVMPMWIAELEEELLRLVFLHEREHQRAGDQRWFAFGLLTAMAMPWNPIVWWQLHRLRLAIEYDCDRRVIERGVSRRDYAEALLAVGSRVSAAPFAAAAFTERKPAVERRLRRMTEPLRRLRGPRAALAAGAGTLALILACGSPPPMSNDTGATAEYTVAEVEKEAPAGVVQRMEGPAFLPYDRPPTLTNRAEIRKKLAEAYPADLEAAGTRGRVELWLHIDEQGEVVGHEVKTSSGVQSLDDAAVEVARTMRFEPALNRDQPTPVWVSQWVTFGNVDETPRRIRETAAGTMTAVENPPLFVIDGVIQDEDFDTSDLSPEDIDHIEVIKGPAAQSIYGERARYGVIQVTTKNAGPSKSRADAPLDGSEGSSRRDGDGRMSTLSPRGTGAETIDAGSIFEFENWKELAPSERPLVLVDGVPMPGTSLPGDLGIAREDMSGLEFIRPPMSEGIYGERARHGALRISTKAPTSGPNG